MNKKKTIVICCSGSFYRHANEVADQLELSGYSAEVPMTAEDMKKSGDYNIEAVKSWYGNPDDFHVKTGKMRGHFDKVAAGDAILVINDTKNGQESYIGPNALMEIGLAFYLNKPIYILNKVPKLDKIPKLASVYEEIYGLGAKFLDGDLTKIKL